VWHMGLYSRALLLCAFLLCVVRFFIQDLSEQEFHREYVRQTGLAHNATVETTHIDGVWQILRTIFMLMQLL